MENVVLADLEFYMTDLRGEESERGKTYSVYYWPVDIGC